MKVDKASWGTKRNCPGCGVDFYDLNHAPAVCPKCKTSFDPSLTARSKRKVAKRSASEEAAENAALQAAIAKKAQTMGKKQKKSESDEEDGDNIGLMEMEEADDIENLHELSELEEMEEELINEDDADEEAIIEELDTGDNVIVGNVEDEEAMEFVKEISDEEQSTGTKKKKSKK